MYMCSSTIVLASSIIDIVAVVYSGEGAFHPYSMYGKVDSQPIRTPYTVCLFLGEWRIIGSVMREDTFPMNFLITVYYTAYLLLRYLVTFTLP